MSGTDFLELSRLLRARNQRNAKMSPGWRVVLALASLAPRATAQAYREAAGQDVPRKVAARVPSKGQPGEWYRIRNSAGGVAVVHVFDEIGYYGLKAADFVAELKAIDAPRIELHINSPGGEVFDGIAIMNALKFHPAEVTVIVDGLAASIASVIAMAGDRIVMAPNSQMMIHNASGVCVGDADDMEELAALLNKQSDNIAAIYAERAGGTVTEWRTRMKAETWYSAAEAVEAGLADEMADAGEMSGAAIRAAVERAVRSALIEREVMITLADLTPERLAAIAHAQRSEP